MLLGYSLLSSISLGSNSSYRRVHSTIDFSVLDRSLQKSTYYIKLNLTFCSIVLMIFFKSIFFLHDIF